MTDLDDLREDGTYLGDGLYARYDAMMGMVGLFTSNGEEITNCVYLEDTTLIAFLKYLKSLGVKLDKVR